MCIYIYIYIYTHIQSLYIYIYISLSLSIYIYIYIYPGRKAVQRRCASDLRRRQQPSPGPSQRDRPYY